MTTTIVRDSIVGDAWIEQTARAVPVQRVIDAETGQPTGDILTGPVRIAFDNLFTLPTPSAQNANPKYGCMLLFTPCFDNTIFVEEYYRVCQASFVENYDAASGQYYGLHSPFRDQSEKLKFGGFTPGCTMMTCNSKFKPPIVDARYNPIVDPSKVYPGVWAIVAVNAYANKDARTKGVRFGIQSVMIIGDDTKFGGGAPDVNKTFASVKGNIQLPTVTASGIAQGMMPGTTTRAPVPGMPGAPVGGTYATSGSRGVPSAPSDPRGTVPVGFDTWAEYDEMMG